MSASLRAFVTLLLAVSTAPRSLSSSVPEDTTTTNIVYRWDEPSSQHGIAAHNGAGDLLGISCSNVLDTGPFASTPIAFDIPSLDYPPSGTISVNGVKYDFDLDKPLGEPSCSVTWNPSKGEGWVEASCGVTGSFDVEGALTTVPGEECFGSSDRSRDLLAGKNTASSYRQHAPSRSEPDPDTTTVSVVYRWDREGSQQGIAAHDEFGHLLAISCSNVLNTGPFASSPVEIDIEPPEERGASQTISVNGVEYSLGGADNETPSKPSCGMAYDPKGTFVEAACEVPGSFDVDGTSTVVHEKCFGASIDSSDLLAGKNLANHHRHWTPFKSESPSAADGSTEKIHAELDSDIVGAADGSTEEIHAELH